MKYEDHFKNPIYKEIDSALDFWNWMNGFNPTGVYKVKLKNSYTFFGIFIKGEYASGFSYYRPHDGFKGFYFGGNGHCLTFEVWCKVAIVSENEKALMMLEHG